MLELALAMSSLHNYPLLLQLDQFVLSETHCHQSYIHLGFTAVPLILNQVQ